MRICVILDVYEHKKVMQNYCIQGSIPLVSTTKKVLIYQKDLDFFNF